MLQLLGGEISSVAHPTIGPIYRVQEITYAIGGHIGNPEVCILGADGKVNAGGDVGRIHLQPTLARDGQVIYRN